jgi:hypothetical protein
MFSASSRSWIRPCRRPTTMSSPAPAMCLTRPIPTTSSRPSRPFSNPEGPEGSSRFRSRLRHGEIRPGRDTTSSAPIAVDRSRSREEARREPGTTDWHAQPATRVSPRLA